MNRTRTLTLTLIALIGMVVVAAFALAQSAQAGVNARSAQLPGSWRAVTTVEAQAITFPSLLTFTSDGAMIADEPPSPFETSGHGNWVSTSRDEVAFTFVSLIGSAEGPLSATIKVVGTLRYDASSDQWSGPFKIDVVGANGSMLLTDRGTFTLTRIKVESLD